MATSDSGPVECYYRRMKEGTLAVTCACGATITVTIELFAGFGAANHVRCENCNKWHEFLGVVKAVKQEAPKKDVDANPPAI